MEIKLFKFIDKVLGTDFSGDAISVSNNAKENIPMCDEKALQKDGNVDKVNLKVVDKRASLYAQLESFCAEYRIDMEVLKEKNFLEQISGKSVESMSEKEVGELFSAIEKTMHRDWKAFWKERDSNDIDEIIYYAKRQYNRDQVGASWLGQKWNDLTTESTLQEELVSAGVISEKTNINSLSDEEFKLKIREYVKKEFLGDLMEYSDAQKTKKYERARKQFVYFVNKFQTDREKILLTAAIDEMDSASKDKLAEILIYSTEAGSECREQVAKSVYDEVSTVKKDALGKTMSKENATNFYVTTYSNMSNEDATLAAKATEEKTTEFMSNHNFDAEKIKQKEAQGIELTDEERYFLNVILSQNAGATIAIPQNTNFAQNEAQEVVSSLLSNAKDNGIASEVIDIVAEYTIDKPETFVNMSTQDFTEMMDEITEGEYSKVLVTKKEYNSITDNETPVMLEKKDNESLDKVSSIENGEIINKEKDNISLKEDVDNSQCSIQVVSILNDFNKQKDYSKTSVALNENKEEKRTVNKERKLEKNANFDNYVTKPNDFESYVRAEGRTKGFERYIEDYGYQEALVEAITNIDLVDEKKVEKIFKQQNSLKQFAVIGNCGTALDKPLDWAKDSTILKLDGKILSCHYATQKAEDAVEKLKERQT